MYTLVVEERGGGEETGCGPDKSGCASWSRSDLFTACELAVPLVAREVWMLVCITTMTRASCVICVSVDGVWVWEGPRGVGGEMGTVIAVK